MIRVMANIEVDQVDGRTARDIMHAQTSTLPADTTVAQARDYFAASTSRRLAVLADAGRYLGTLTPADLHADTDPSRPAIEVVGRRATVAPQWPAAVARDLALASDTRRVPVVDADGTYLGMVSLNRSLEWFCGTG